MSDAPKFNCTACGKEYRWKPELAGKKAKCKCGATISVPAQPEVVVEPAEEDLYALAGSVEQPVPEQAAAVARVAPQASRAPVAPGRTVMKPAAAAAAPEAQARQLKWAPALKWIFFGLLCAGLALWELSSPTDPDAPGRRRGLRAIVVFVNMFAGPMGGVIVFGLLAAFFLVVGVLILLGKTKDDEYEHEQEKDQWPASRGKRY